MIREPLRVLIVEDNPGDATLVAERLSQIEDVVFAVTVAPSLQMASARLADQEFDAVIVDLHLPDCSGVETLRRLGRVRDVTPFVVVSGAIDETVRSEALREGAEEVISKEEANSRLFGLSVLYVIERNRAEEQQRRMEKLLAVSPDAVVLVNGGGRVQYVNDATLQLFGRDREQIVGEQLWFSALEGVPVELRIPRSGTERVAEMRVVNFEWQGKQSMLATIRDITDQKLLQTQIMVSDRMASVGTLAAGVAHEINNPLVAVLANLEFAMQDLPRLGPAAETSPVMSDLRDALRDARDAADRVRHIVKDLKLFSRAEEDKRSTVDVQRVMESTLRMAWNEIRHRARLVKDYGKVPLVDANEARLGQVFLNLVVNAAQAIPEGRADANEIRIGTSMDGRGRVVVEFRDTGPGIPAEVLGRLFTPFFTTKPAGVGTGLGLAICQRIVTGIGGEITVESKLGVGTVFRVFLVPALEPPIEEVVAAPSAAPASRRGRVMVIDDEAAIGAAVRRALSAEHDVKVFTNAADAIALIGSGERFDVIFCDLMMPVVTGMDVYEKLIEAAREQAERIVFLTGGAFTVRAREFLDHVPNTRIEKPFVIQNLKALVNERVR